MPAGEVPAGEVPGGDPPDDERVTGIVGGCVSVTLALSVDVLTLGAAWIAALAIVALVLTGWRQPARAQPRLRRGDPNGPVVEVEHQPTEPYRRTGPIRRLLAALAGAGIAVVTGVVVATVLAFAIAIVVIRLTGLLAG